jgi:hypothetical protein
MTIPFLVTFSIISIKAVHLILPLKNPAIKLLIVLNWQRKVNPFNRRVTYLLITFVIETSAMKVINVYFLIVVLLFCVNNSSARKSLGVFDNNADVGKSIP